MQARTWRANAITGILLLAIAFLPTAGATGRPLSLDDVFALSRVDSATISPDGKHTAVVIQRPVTAGETYGRTFYDLDPSRSDVWVISHETGRRVNVTQGGASGAGFWCAAWSPDGRRLAMLSTSAEGSEPRGGDNVRLYVWERDEARPRRIHAAAVMTQTRSAMHRLDVRGSRGQDASRKRCHSYENAPFVWLDQNRLLAVTLPSGSVSGLLDEFDRPVRHTSNTATAIRRGERPTATAVGSGAEATSWNSDPRTADLQIISARTGKTRRIGAVPIYPFRGELTVSMAPGERHLAVLATTGAIPPTAGARIPSGSDTWSVAKRLGLIDLRADTPIRWIQMPSSARYPAQVLSWSPDGGQLAFRARERSDTTTTPLFVLSSRDLGVRRLGNIEQTVAGLEVGADYGTDTPALWLDDGRLLARLEGSSTVGQTAASRRDWWLLAPGSAPTDATAALAEPPSQIRKMRSGQLVALSNERLLCLIPGARSLSLRRSVHLPGAYALLPAGSSERADEGVVVATASAGGSELHLFSPDCRRINRRPAVLSPTHNLLDANVGAGVAVVQENGRAGTRITGLGLARGTWRELTSLNQHLASLEWGDVRIEEYPDPAGAQRRAAVLLPPGYEEGKKYPTLVWVYPSYQVSGPQDYFLNPHMAGFYNLHLYAARGYVVVVPSLPLGPAGDARPVGVRLAEGVRSALAHLSERGIVDRDRVGVFGQSYGGYAVYSLLAHADLFRAGVGIAGISDLEDFYSEFDATARGYDGIEHEKSYNFSILEQIRISRPPFEQTGDYLRDSPIASINRVRVPLLLVHGEYDARGQSSQAESFFYQLHSLGRTARLLRVWGEDHGISRSPANVRLVFDETIAWFDRYVAGSDPKSEGRSLLVPDAHRR